MPNRKVFTFSWDLSVRRPEAIAMIKSVEFQSRRQGKTIKAVNRLKDALLNLSSSTRELSDATSAISKSLQNLQTVKSEKRMAKVYPIQIESVSLDHSGGTKSYHAKKLVAQSGKSLVIFRWGKTGTFGDIQVFEFDTASEADKAFEKKLASKMSNGYAISPRHDPKPVKADDFEELRALMGRAMMSKIGASNLKYIDPTADTTGMREVELPRLDEEGRINWEAVTERSLRLEEEKRKAREEIAARERAEAESAYSNNPIWGAF